MTHVSHSKMLSTRRRNQSRKKLLRRAGKQARRKALAAKSPGKAKA
ncbi:MAG TPA: hypothetical protein VFK92_04390 [Burkholderiales bacterium]|nr:hypothetical protein [Burkholderiales bacterium]